MTPHEAAKFAALRAVADYFEGKATEAYPRELEQEPIYMAVTGALSRVCPQPIHTMRLVHNRLMTDFSHLKLDNEERARLGLTLELLEQAIEGGEKP